MLHWLTFVGLSKRVLFTKWTLMAGWLHNVKCLSLCKIRTVSIPEWLLDGKAVLLGMVCSYIWKCIRKLQRAYEEYIDCLKLMMVETATRHLFYSEFALDRAPVHFLGRLKFKKTAPLWGDLWHNKNVIYTIKFKFLLKTGLIE